jgi:hypothetical protein
MVVNYIKEKKYKIYMAPKMPSGSAMFDTTDPFSYWFQSHVSSDMVAHACDPNYFGGRD